MEIFFLLPAHQPRIIILGSFIWFEADAEINLFDHSRYSYQQFF